MATARQFLGTEDDIERESQGLLQATRGEVVKTLTDLEGFDFDVPHYKKPVFFVMFKKTQKNVQKNRDDVQKNKDDVHKTSPKIGSTETCKKHGKKLHSTWTMFTLTCPC